MTLIDLDERSARHPVGPALATIGPPLLAPPAPPRDNRQVLYGIRALLAGIFGVLMVILLTILAIASGQGAPGGVSRMDAPVTLQLLQPGPDPAVDYYAHAVFADGSERDLQLGGYVLHNGLVRVELGVTAEMGSQSGCRIVIDGVRVTEELATDGGSTVCRWAAP